MEQSVGQVRRFVAFFEVFEVLELITTSALNQLDEISLILLWPWRTPCEYLMKAKHCCIMNGGMMSYLAVLHYSPVQIPMGVSVIAVDAMFVQPNE